MNKKPRNFYSRPYFVSVGLLYFSIIISGLAKKSAVLVDKVSQERIIFVRVNAGFKSDYNIRTIIACLNKREEMSSHERISTRVRTHTRTTQYVRYR